MTLQNFLKLILLAGVWGSSFLFIRIGAQELAPAFLVELRLFFAGGFLLLLSYFIKKPLNLLKHKSYYFKMGLVNTCIPFLLFAYAAQSLSSSVMSILNASTAIWGSLIGFVVFKEHCSLKSIIGLLVGILGVVVLIGFNPAGEDEVNYLAVAAALGATLCYAISSHYSKRNCKVSAFENTHGSLWMAFIIALPILFFHQPTQMPSLTAIESMAMLGVFCTALAFLLYFKLIEDIGPTSTLTVMFLVPLFGILWGWLLLDEQIGLNTFIGTSMILIGTMLVTNFSLRSVFSK